ncbi:MAG TPA: ABC transporter substrate-binding protein, partial [Burkholderiaceae bacterium]|nr:ABC transporter substrate-binding protein [Burkholderiaceae bacterium]
MNSRTIFKTTLLGVALAFAATSASADNIRLRFHTYYGTEMDAIAKKMQDMVREESDGSMRIQYFRGGELVDSDQFVEATAGGTIDVAYGVGSYWPGQVDIANIEAGLPGAWTSADEAREVFEQLNPILEEAYEEKGVKLIGRGFGSNYDLLTKEP